MDLFFSRRKGNKKKSKEHGAKSMEHGVGNKERKEWGRV
jgi:hypothetical protein